MKATICIENNMVVSQINLPDGYYDITIKQKDVSKTVAQCRKLWATVDDISRHEYGDVSESGLIYLQILERAGVDTYGGIIAEEGFEQLKKKTRAITILSKEVINHREYINYRACFKGISEMSKKQVSEVIDTAIRWCAELGIETELEGWN